MHPKTKSKRPVVDGYVPGNVLADLLNRKSKPVTPELAAERAANRIIQAVKEREKKQ